MRTLLLCSSGSFLTRHRDALDFLPKPIASMQIAYITTASKSVDDVDYMHRHIEQMDKFGYQYEPMDLDGKISDDVRAMLRGKDMVFVEGGNTFYLLKAARQSGFQSVMEELFDKGVIYVGSSAGAYLACPTIEVTMWRHADWYEQCGFTDLTAFEWVPFLLLAHYDPKDAEFLQQKIAHASHPVRMLTDEQALLIQGDKMRALGKNLEK